MICTWCGDECPVTDSRTLATGEIVHERCGGECRSCGSVVLPGGLHDQHETGDRVCNACDRPPVPEETVDDILWRRRQARIEPREWYETGGYWT